MVKMRIRKSMFARLFLGFTLLAVTVFGTLGYVISSAIERQLTEQKLALSGQQLEMLGTLYTQQQNNLLFLGDRLHDVKTEAGTTLYDAISFVLKDSAHVFNSAQHYSDYINHTSMVFTYFNLVQNATEMPPKLIGITSTAWGEKHFIWPMRSLYAVDFSQAVSRMIPAPKMAGAQGGILPNVQITGRKNENSQYVLYEYLWDTELPEQLNGCIFYCYDVDNLNDMLIRSCHEILGDAYLMDASGLVVYDTSTTRQGCTIPNAPQIISAVGTSYKSGDIIYNVKAVNGSKLYAINEIKAESIYGAISKMRTTILILIGVLCGSMLLAISQAVRNVSENVSRIQHAMHEAEQGNLEARAEIKVEDELGVLAQSCNEMIEKLDKYIKREYVDALRRRDVELQMRTTALAALQNQINPHFLYNTLETIRMQAVINGDHETAQLIERLSQLFRARLTLDSITHLGKELNTCQAIIGIMGARFGEDLCVRIDCPEQELEAGMLKDLLEPLVENAFIHGLYEVSEQSAKQLIIAVTRSGEFMQIDVKNSCDGYVDAPDTTQDKGAGHLGLRNVEQRVRLIYGNECGLSYISAESEFTVRLKLRALTYLELKALSSREE